MKAGTSAGAWREAQRLLRSQRALLMPALALVVVNRVAALALPTASKYVVDDVIGRERSDQLGLIALLACAAVAIETAAAFGAVQHAGLAGQLAIAGLRQELQERVVGLPLSRIDEARSGSLASQVMTDSEQVRFLVGTGSVQLVASMLTAVLALALLFRLDPWLTLPVLAILGLLGIGVTCGFGRVTAAFEQVCRRQAELTGWLAQILSGIRVVKACAAERREAHRFAQESHALVRETIDALRRVALLSTGTTLAAGAVGVLLLVEGSRAVSAGTMTLGSLVMFTWLSGLLFAPVMHLAGSAGELGKAMAALGRIAQLKALPTEGEEDRSRGRPGKVVGTVDAEQVTYAYAPGRLVLREVSLHAPAGCTTALVGPSGSGKSTLCRLLLAFDRPTSGRLLVDSRDLSAVRRREYRAHLGVVLQEDVLFDGTIADNIRYGRPRARWADVLAAGRLAHCDEFADMLPGGYGTLIGERGVRLSGGQRQRIAIARAMLADPRILILDEATSNLDSESEQLIQAALRVLCRGRTTFLIAHRLSTVRSADQILMLDRGSVSERGTHCELMASRGRYFALHDVQAREWPNSLPASTVPAGLGLSAYCRPALPSVEAEVMRVTDSLRPSAPLGRAALSSLLGLCGLCEPGGETGSGGGRS